MRSIKLLFVIICFAFLLLQLNSVLAYECNKASVGYKHVYSVSKGYDPDYLEKVKSEKGFTPTPSYTIFDELELTFKFGLDWETTNCPFIPADADPDLLQGDLCVEVSSLQSFLAGDCTSLEGELRLAAYVELNGTLYSVGKDYATYSADLRVDSTIGGVQKMGIDFKGIPDEVMEELISKIDRDGKIKIKIYGSPNNVIYSLPPRVFKPDDISDPNYYDGYYRLVDEIEIPMTNCYHVSGDGKHRVITMRGASAEMDFERPVDSINLEVIPGFSSIDPFKTYFNRFSFYADLKNYQKEPVLRMSLAGESSLSGLPESSCSGSSIIAFYGRVKKMYYLLGEVPLSVYAVATNDGSGAILFNVNNYVGTAPVNYVQIFAHEVGHSFAKLNDEIPPHERNSLLHDLRISQIQSERNCQKSISKFVYNNVLYGNGRLGCGKTFSLYTPSYASLMSEDYYMSKFNVVSCGYVISAIKGGDPKSYWSECMELDTVRPYCPWEIDCPIGFTCKEDSLCRPSG